MREKRLLRRQSCISRACPAYLERIITGIELRIWDFRYGYFAEPILSDLYLIIVCPCPEPPD